MPTNNFTEDILRNIVQGNTNLVVADNERQYKMIEQGSRIPNAVLKETVKKMREKGRTDKKIIDDILFFDGLAEKGQLTDYLDKNKKKT